MGSAAVGVVAFAATYFADRHRARRGRARVPRPRRSRAPTSVAAGSCASASSRPPGPTGSATWARPSPPGDRSRHALTTLAETGPPALRDAFARFPLLARMLGTVPALEIVKAELADPTSDRVIEVLILAQERGGPIVRQILEDLVVATTKDLKVLDEIESEGLEMKINARAVLVMPWLVLVALTLRAGPFRAFYQSPAGVLVGGRRRAS